MEEEIGKVSHFFSKISVAAIMLSKTLKIGDAIHIKGPNTDIEMKVDSMQIDRKPIKEAKKGQDVGIKIPGEAKEKDIVYKKTI